MGGLPDARSVADVFGMWATGLALLLALGTIVPMLAHSGILEGICDGIWHIATLKTRRREAKAMRDSETAERRAYARWLDTEVLRVEVDARLQDCDPAPDLLLLNQAAETNNQKLVQLLNGGRPSKAGEFMFEKQKLREKLGLKKDQAPRENCR